DVSPIQLVTSSFPGVTATNPAPTYSPVSLVGTGVGLVTPGGTPTGGAHSVVVRIDTAGTVAGSTALWSVNVDNGGWVAHSTYSAVSIGSSMTVTLTDNSGTFVQGDAYYFQTPGRDITQVGADAETPQQLGTRCRGLIPALAFAKDSNGNWIPGSPTASAYTTLALNANSQVRIVLVRTDPAVNNKVNIIIAGQGGIPLLSSIVANEQAFFNSFQFDTDRVAVATTTGRAITLAGLTITVRAGSSPARRPRSPSGGRSISARWTSSRRSASTAWWTTTTCYRSRAPRRASPRSTAR